MKVLSVQRALDPPQGGTTGTKRKKILIGAGIGLGLLLVIGVLTSEEEDPTPQPAVQVKTPKVQPTATPIPTPVPAVKISAAKLYQERKDNATRFDMNYKDQWVKVTGIVGQVEDGDVRLVVDMAAYSAFGDLLLEFIALQDLPTEVQASAERDEPFTATCKVGNYVLGTMYLEECSVGD